MRIFFLFCLNIRGGTRPLSHETRLGSQERDKIFRLFFLKILNYEIQWGKKVFSQPPIVQVLPLKKMREACNFHHRYTSTMRDKIRKKNPENHIVGFLKNLFANYGGK